MALYRSRRKADAILLMTEQYREEEKELKLEAFKNHLASIPPTPRKKPWSSRNSRSYREVKSGVK
jgi:hypothetical protein